ncbi:clpC, partial [Symbiodinium pilosum]
KKQADTQLPLQYTFIILTPLLSIGMDGFVAFIRSGVPTECLVSYGFSVVLGVLLCWAAVVVRMGVFLCDRFAAPCASGLCDYLQSVAIFLVFVVAIFAGVGIGAGSYTRGTGPAFS